MVYENLNRPVAVEGSVIRLKDGSSVISQCPAYLPSSPSWVIEQKSCYTQEVQTLRTIVGETFNGQIDAENLQLARSGNPRDLDSIPARVHKTQGIYDGLSNRSDGVPLSRCFRV